MKSAGELALDACDARDSITIATASNADQKKHIQELVSSVKKAVTDLDHARTNHRRAQRDQAQAESTRVKELSDAQAGAQEKKLRQKKQDGSDILSASEADNDSYKVRVFTVPQVQKIVADAEA